MDTLNRGQAPFSDKVWHAIDKAAVEAARDRLTARRFLDVEGPFGVGMTTIEVGNDDYCRQPGPDEAGGIMSRAIPVPMLRRRRANNRDCSTRRRSQTSIWRISARGNRSTTMGLLAGG